MLWLVLTPIIIFTVILFSYLTKRKVSLTNKHVVITGGSSGIGKELAILAVKRGAHVSIIARNQERLNEAYNTIKEASISNDQLITTIAVDVSKHDELQSALTKLESAVPIFMLVNCAGFATCGIIEDFTIEEIKNLIDVNYLGTVYAIKTVLPKFKERKEGIIVLTASQAALMGMYGYSVYSSCKFALRGLAESLNMELKPYNISITLALPPDTDTPGFANENKTKPLETKLISSAGGLYKPEDVAKRILEDSLSCRFFSVTGFESFLLTTLCVGMSPMNTIWELLLQMCLLGPFRAIGVIYLSSFHNIIKKCRDDRNMQHLK